MSLESELQVACKYNMSILGVKPQGYANMEHAALSQIKLWHAIPYIFHV
jgi:hypothetical protein